MKQFLPVVCLLALFSCNRGTEQQQENQDSIKTTIDSNQVTLSDAHYFWEADLSGKTMVMKKTRIASPDSLNVSSVIGMLNTEYPDLKLTMLKTSGDTVFIKVENERHLTQRIGSTGAETVLAEITYNLTEVSGIQHVKLDFRQGDHATPGTYGRTDFVEP